MGYILEDGRLLTAAYNDIRNFFDVNNVIGKTIRDIRPAALDYMIQNLHEVDSVYLMEECSGILTYDRIGIIFSDRSSVEIEFSGEGPVILGYNTVDFNKYPDYDGSCYSLHTLFRNCLGRTVSDIIIEQTESRMLFPVCRGIDLSDEDEGIEGIRIVLDDESVLTFSGEMDGFSVEHRLASGDYAKEPLCELLDELNQETLERIFPEEEMNKLHCPKYSELYAPKYLDLFPEEPVSELTEEQSAALKSLSNIIDQIYFEVMYFEMYADDPKFRPSIAGKEELKKAAARWGSPIRFREIVEKLRNKTKNGDIYKVRSEWLSVDEAAFLVLLPFFSRMGGSFEEDFARDGRLGKYLRILKRKDTPSL